MALTETRSFGSPAPKSDTKPGFFSTVDPFTKAKEIITATEGLNNEEKDGIAKSFESRFGNATITTFIPIFARREVTSALRSKTISQPSPVSQSETSSPPEQDEMIPKPKRRGVLFWRGSKPKFQ